MIGSAGAAPSARITIAMPAAASESSGAMASQLTVGVVIGGVIGHEPEVDRFAGVTPGGSFVAA